MTTANQVKKNVQNVSLGLAQAFINGVDVGFVEQVSANIEWEDFDFEQGTPLGTEASLRIRENATIVIQHAEFSAERISFALPGAETSTGGTLSSLEETITLTATDAVPLAAASEGFAAESAIVMNVDRTVKYTPVTDYTFDKTAATITRVALGAIADGQDVVVDYTYTDTNAQVIDFGGSRLCKAQTFHTMLLHHEKAQTCIPIEILAHKVRATSPLNIQFAKDAIIVPEITYRVYIDRTKPRGQRLIRVTEGSVSLVTL